MTARYMPPMCQAYGPNLGAELQHAVEARLSDLGIPNPTEADIARAIAHEEEIPMNDITNAPAAFGPWIPWSPGDVIPHEWILADISSEISSGYMWVLSSQVGTRDCACIRRYCLPIGC